MWDTFRTTHPWFTLALPTKANDFARSLVQMLEDGGSMPRWAHGHGYTSGMVGTPAAQILAGTWLKGVRDWDAATGFDGGEGITPAMQPGLPCRRMPRLSGCGVSKGSDPTGSVSSSSRR